MIYLMRHGESDVNLSKTLSCRRVDTPLTEDGVRQAEQVAAWLADKPIRRLYVSPMLRAMQTAEIAGRRLGLACAIDEALREVDCGDLEGRNDTAAWDIYRQIVVRWISGDIDLGFDGGETGRQAMDRFTRFMHDLPDGEGDVLVVGHGGIFAWGLLRLCYDLRPKEAWDLYLPNTGLVVVDRTPQGYSCVQWGLAEHLDQSPVIDVPEEMME